MSYPFKQIEQKWQKYWADNKTFQTNLDNFNQPKCYVLDMFPYPSGSGLHVGHPKGYCATDVFARFKKMNGFNVLHPIGWDAFGLPAEQYALTTGNDPAIFTEKNINTFREQLKKIGFSFDYSKEVNTTDPEYYRWTQWIFIKLYENGLAQLEEQEVNFCPILGTVLANEEIVNVNGFMVSERGHYPVEKRLLKQWVLKITKYAEQLLNGLEDLDWPNSVKELQKNWIGKSKGAIVTFSLFNSNEQIQVFTTRIDTIFGVTFLAISPENNLVNKLITNEQKNTVETYLKLVKNKSDLTRQSLDNLKSGVFTGSFALNPITGEQIPIWIADYVLNHYGTGAIMGVPNGDERDFLFSKTHNIAYKQIFSEGCNYSNMNDETTYVNSEFINNLTKNKAQKKVLDFLVSKKQAFEKITYKLHDWLFSRQRYWGEPFPLIHWDDGKISTLPFSELPLKLPKINNIKPSKDGLAPLNNADKSWLCVTRKDGVKGRREINTMPQWAGSCWYYLAYLLRDNNQYLNFESFAAKQRFQHWLPVDLYIGGQEHAVLHLLYARFWNLVLFDLKLVTYPEPFIKLINQGMILGANNEKMSKSRGNVINPDDIISQYGADSLRLYELFIGPITASLPWQEGGLIGIHKFLTRVYRLFTSKEQKQKFTDNNNQELAVCYNQTVAKVTEDINNYSYNTAISQLMIFINQCYKADKIYQPYLHGFLQLLNPFAPHLSAELWSFIQATVDINNKWPEYEKDILKTPIIDLIVQINGKKRAIIKAKRDSNLEQVLTIIKKEPRLTTYLSGHECKKTIFIINKIINLIV